MRACVADGRRETEGGGGLARGRTTPKQVARNGVARSETNSHSEPNHARVCQSTLCTSVESSCVSKMYPSGIHVRKRCSVASVAFSRLCRCVFERMNSHSRKISRAGSVVVVVSRHRRSPPRRPPPRDAAHARRDAHPAEGGGRSASASARISDAPSATKARASSPADQHRSARCGVTQISSAAHLSTTTTRYRDQHIATATASAGNERRMRTYLRELGVERLLERADLGGRHRVLREVKHVLGEQPQDLHVVLAEHLRRLARAADVADEPRPVVRPLLLEDLHEDLWDRSIDSAKSKIRIED